MEDVMSLLRFSLLAGTLGYLLCACSSGAEVKPTERQFYKNPYVRRCLQYDKEQMATESKVCWARLHKRIQSKPDFVEEAKFTESDIAKIGKMVSHSTRRSTHLKKERDQCLNISSTKRDERIKCFQAYLSRYGAELSRSQKFEIESAIASLRQSRVRASGEVEETIERAGKLLGGQLHEEKEGIRIDAIVAGPMQQAGLKEQGIIVAVNDQPVKDLSSAERIARLEACEDQTVILLVRHGGIGNITFARAETRCGQAAAGKRLWEVVLKNETCTTAENNPEILLGISWCYLAKEGILEVEEVCKDSPAAAAGVRPEHRYISINGTLLLGKTIPQIAELLKDYPNTPLTRREQGGALKSPTPLSAQPLNADQAKKCWQAVKSAVGEEDAPGTE
jgi:C-terminal processing protease CtpA/Prc